MFKAGVFDGADVIVRSHSVSSTVRPAAGFGTCCLNIDGVKYTFSGAPAHQMTPWAGRNALEAVIHLFNNIDAARTTMRPETRIQGVITEGGAAPNVVPDRTQADFYIRYPDAVYLAQVREAVDNAARAAALATGTKVKIDNYGQMRDGISLATLAEVGFAHMKAIRRHPHCRRARQAGGVRGDGHGVERDSRDGIRRLYVDCRQPYLPDGGGRADRCGAPGIYRGCPGDDGAAIRFRHRTPTIGPP
jgi:metal-dependent amidase/aminoacylase/carboxypeptidase family protein